MLRRRQLLTVCCLPLQISDKIGSIILAKTVLLSDGSIPIVSLDS